MSVDQRGKVHIRTPTYKRPDGLRRCIQSMQAQTWQNWVCDVYDDDQAGSAQAVVDEIGDPRVVFNQNTPQRFASKNIDQCFSRDNPRDADFFCVLEDDNLILPTFLAENIRVCREQGVELLMRNQLVEYDSGTPEARFSDGGIFDKKFREGRYKADHFRLAVIPGIGVSNGALFWTRSAKSPLEIGFSCTATFQEYMRTLSIWEDIYIAMEPLAVWAENGEQTTRDLGDQASYVRRELDLKRAVQRLQRAAWKLTSKDRRADFMTADGLYSEAEKARGLLKGLITTRVGSSVPLREKIELIARGILIRFGGRQPDDLEDFIKSRVKL